MTELDNRPLAETHYPGPKTGLSFISKMQADAPGIFVRSQAEFGDVVRFKLPFRGNSYLIVDPDLIEQVLVRKNEHFIKGLLTRDLKHIFGNGLLVSEGDEWRRNRKLASPPFTKRAIGSYADDMASITARHTAGMSPEIERNVHDDMMKLTLEIVVQCIFGSGLPREADGIGEAIDEVLDHYTNYSRSLLRYLPRWLPTPGNVKLERAIHHIRSVVDTIIAKKRSELNDEANDLLSLLLRARDDEGTGFTNQQLRDEAITMFVAGHETTALALSYALMQLAANPDVLAKAHAEVDAVLGSRAATAADMTKLTLCASIITESMRLHPPVWVFGREVISRFELDGHMFVPGEQVWCSAWVNHRDPRWFADPLEFKPERWTAELEASLPRFAYFPFGGGPRVCIGNHFAMMEGALVLATILQKRTFTTGPNHQLVYEISATMRPKLGVRLVPHQR
jgi:cytochrome P450